MTWPDFPLAFYPVAIIAILVTGIAKAGFGSGSGGIAVPLMAIFIAPQQAAGIMLPILCAMDILGAYAYRGGWSVAHLRALLPGALIGITIGALAFGTLPIFAIRLLLGTIAVSFALNQWFSLTARFVASHSQPGRAAGWFWGAASGFTSTLAHAGGPPFAVYMLAQRIDKTLLVSTSVAFFLVVNYAKLIPYALLGQLSVPNLTASLVLAPLAPIGIALGVFLHRHLSERAFYRASYAILFGTGVKLIYDAFA